VDLFDSKELPVHHAVLRHDMAILEGLLLRDVPAGIYEVIALPLRLVGFDASPVRAILRPLAKGR
jgi:arylformamidase